MKKINILLLSFMTFNVYAEMSQTNQVLKAESDRLVETFKPMTPAEAEVLKQKNMDSINRNNLKQGVLAPEISGEKCVFEKHEIFYKNYNADILNKTKSLSGNYGGENSVLPNVDIRVGEKTSYAISWLNNLDKARKGEKFKKCMESRFKNPESSSLPSCPTNANQQEVSMHKDKVERLYFNALSNYTSFKECVVETKIQGVRGFDYSLFELQSPTKPEFTTKF